MPTIDLIYFNAGGGHRAAAQALQQTIALQQRPWRVRLVNLAEVLDPQRRFERLTGIAPEQLYNKRLQRGWTLGLQHELKLLQGLIRFTHKRMLATLQRHWAQTEPDLVVSLVPNFNRVLCESVASALPGVPCVTVMTDMADHPPHFWVEPGLQQTLVCGTPHAMQQALRAGCDPAQLMLASGMVLRPAFYAPPATERTRAMLALGLDPMRPTGVVMFGGQGSQQMLQIARALPDVQLLLLCGHNTTLAQRLKSLHRSVPHAVLGFTEDIGNTLRLGDFFIGKPGPGAISEAVQLGLPVLTWRNAWTMPQERYNTEWVREKGVGIVIPSMRELRPAVAEMLLTLPVLRSQAQQVRNRAVFEVTALFERQLAQATRSDVGRPAPGLAPRWAARPAVALA
jgi:UDP-N-acetylglucosamine:LPS N-acetylglucosamine transferase